MTVSRALVEKELVRFGRNCTYGKMLVALLEADDALRQVHDYAVLSELALQSGHTMLTAQEIARKSRLAP